jgi:hypothetical protein
MWRTHDIPRGNTRKTEYVEESWYDGRCDKECITNACQCCGYRWEIDPLPNAGGEVTPPITPTHP